MTLKIINAWAAHHGILAYRLECSSKEEDRHLVGRSSNFLRDTHAFEYFSGENDRITVPTGLWRTLCRMLEWPLWRKGPETNPGTLISSKEKSKWSSQEMWLWTRKATVSWLTLYWTFPKCFSHEASVWLGFGGPVCSVTETASTQRPPEKNPGRQQII